ncbi:MAG: EAL domain-containing protein [Treponema sp.]|nr:EAL domain-containing protein [Treponema sp.]
MKRKEENYLFDCYNEKTFYRETDVYLQKNHGIAHSMLAIEIDNFRFFRLWYGKELGDTYLSLVAKTLLQFQTQFGGIVGYFGGAQFALCIPSDAQQIQMIEKKLAECRVLPSDINGFFTVTGIYHIDDGMLSSEVMYDRAAIALASVRGNHLARSVEYDKDIGKVLDEEIKMLADIQRGLDEDEFVFYVQPKCDMRSGKILGAEALVRWIHKDSGLVLPGRFMPLLEKSGFTSFIDKFIWEKVCAWQRSWIDSGHKPLPISVNVSRTDLFSFDVAAFFIALVKKYDIAPHLIEIEITESAYAENYTAIGEAINKLKEAGFPMLMDDFGSGYSSLNMLRNISFDILKFDMKFLRGSDESRKRGLDILESVVNMARLINVPVIMEGVETTDQVKFLVDMGCRYAQGYYYYKPMSVQDFETLLADETRVDYSGYTGKSVDQIHLRELMESTDVTDTLLNDLMGPVAFYDMFGGTIEIERVNEPYYRYFQAGSDSTLSVADGHVQKSEYGKLQEQFERAYRDAPKGAFGAFHYTRRDGSIRWVYLRLFFLREQNGHRHFYGSLTDISGLAQHAQLDAYEKNTNINVDELKQSYRELQKSYEFQQLRFEQLQLNEEMYRVAMGLTNHAIMVIDIPNRTVNQIYNEGSRTRISSSMTDAPESIIKTGTIHPNDCDGYREFFRKIYSGVPKCEYTMRVMEKNRGWVWFAMYSQTVFDESGTPVRAIAFSTNITSEKQAEEKYKQYRAAVAIGADFVWEVNLTNDELFLQDDTLPKFIGESKLKTYDEFSRAVFERILDSRQKNEALEKFRRENLINAFNRGEREVSQEYQLDFDDGKGMRWLRSTAYLMMNSVADICVILSTVDITKSHLETAALEMRAESDPLTGLFNHATMEQRVSHVLREADTDFHAMLMIDIDNFKQCNDTYGHVFGDKVLQTVAEVLHDVFRHSDYIGRIGGDEFMVFMVHAGNLIIVKSKAVRMLKAITDACKAKKFETEVTLSIGIAVSHHDDNFAAMYERADKALYQSKKGGKNRIETEGI